MPFRLRPLRFQFTLLSFFLALFCGSLAGVAIFLILAAIPTSKPSRHSPATSTDITIKSIIKAIELYRLDVGESPPNLQALLKPPSQMPNSAGWRGPYLSNEKLPLDPWRNEYQYEQLAATTGAYRVWSKGPDRLSNTADDIFEP